MKIKIHNEFTVQEFFLHGPSPTPRIKSSCSVSTSMVNSEFRSILGNSLYLIAEKFRWKWCSHGAVQSLARCGLEEGEELEKTEKTKKNGVKLGVARSRTTHVVMYI